MSEVAEGVATTPAASKLADKHGISAPIIKTVEKVLNGEMEPRDAVNFLMVSEASLETHYILTPSPHVAARGLQTK
jgi:glycerol-3-phosphate dehydrogenase